MKRPATRVLVADDHGVVRMGLSSLLASEPGMNVVGVAANGEAAVEAALRLLPDVVVMDLKMPRMDGVEATRRISEAAPGVKVVALTSYGISTMIRAALDAGACGAVMKSATDGEIIDAIREVAAGGRHVSREILEEMRNNPPLHSLTARQKEILCRMAQGLTNEDIAMAMGISRDTIGEHVTAILRKLDAANRTEAVAVALRNLLV